MTHEEYDALEEIVGGTYNRGYADGLKTGHEGGYRSSYEKGLEDAWECAKKIASLPTDVTEPMFNQFGLHNIMAHISPLEAMQKIKGYEERHDCENCAKAISAECVVDGCEFEPKQDEKLCDRCKNSKLCELNYLKYVNTCSDFCPKTDDTDSDEIKVGDEVVMFQYPYIVVRIRDDGTFDGIDGYGCDIGLTLSNFHKTGRHFDAITEILEQLRGEE